MDKSKFLDWMPPILEVLKEKGGSATSKEVRLGIIDKMNLNDDFVNEKLEKSNQPRFDVQVNWASVYLTWEGLVEKPNRGVWALTEDGWGRELNLTES